MCSRESGELELKQPTIDLLLKKRISKVAIAHGKKEREGERKRRIRGPKLHASVHQSI